MMVRFVPASCQRCGRPARDLLAARLGARAIQPQWGVSAGAFSPFLARYHHGCSLVATNLPPCSAWHRCGIKDGPPLRKGTLVGFPHQEWQETTMAAIGRFGTRVVPEMSQIIQQCRNRKQLVQGPCIERFEEEFARFLGSGHVRTCSTEYGRMALYFILKAMDLPPGSEIVVPAFTFWVVPEIARVAGLTPVFADIDPVTFTLSPGATYRVGRAATVASCAG